MFRGLDLVVYIALIAAVLYVVYSGAGPQPPAAPRFDPEGERVVLPPPSDLDPIVIVELPADAAPSSGTAFSIGGGAWLTARHVVDGCDQVGLLVSGDQGVLVQDVVVSDNADLAIVRAPLKRSPFRLQLDPDARRIGENGFHIGYPQGFPGETASRLLGREVIAISGRFRARAPVLAWVETARTAGLAGSLGGISGGPALGERGDVVGVVIAEAPRRGRIYTAAPSSITELLQRTDLAPDTRAPSAGDLNEETYDDIARRLRRNLQVAKVVCVVV